MECADCESEFNLNTEYAITYSTSKIDCKDGECVFRAPECHHISQDLCDRWNKEVFLGRADWAPYTTWEKVCKKCDQKERIEVDHEEACPDTFSGNT